jgi:hypothetical protein
MGGGEIIIAENSKNIVILTNVIWENNQIYFSYHENI